MAIVYLVPAIFDAALGIFGFALPLFLVDRGVPPLAIGSLLALPAMTQILLRIPAGMLAGRIGNIRAMLIGCSLISVSAGLVASSPHGGAMVAMVAAAQVLSGLGRASFWPANQAHLFEVSGERVASVIGLYNFLVTLGGMSGPLMAGLLITGAGPASAFWLLAALAVSSGSLLAWREGRSARRQAATAARLAEEYPDLAAAVDTTATGGLDTGAALGGGAGDEVSAPVTGARLAGPGVGADHPVRSLARVARAPAVWLAGLICIGSVIPFIVTTSFFQVYMRDLGASAASISLLVTVRLAAVAMFSLVTSSSVRPRTRSGLLLLSGAVGGLGLALIPLLSDTGLAVLPMLLLGFCGGAMHNVRMAVAGESVAPADRALAMALVGSVGNLAMMVTPLWHGWMASRGMLADAFSLTGLVLLVVGATSWQWSRAQVSRVRSQPVQA